MQGEALQGGARSDAACSGFVAHGWSRQSWQCSAGKRSPGSGQARLVEAVQVRHGTSRSSRGVVRYRSRGSARLVRASQRSVRSGLAVNARNGKAGFVRAWFCASVHGSRRLASLDMSRLGEVRSGSQGGVGIVVASQRWAAQFRLREARHRSTSLVRARQSCPGWVRRGLSTQRTARYCSAGFGSRGSAWCVVAARGLPGAVRQGSQGTAWWF